MICGMGGELILRIVTECSYTRKEGVRLLLQPQSSFAEMREGLCEAGYGIIDESLVRDGHMIYQVTVFEYTGEKTALTPAEALLGPKNIEKGGALFSEYASIHLRKLKRKIASKGGAGYDVSADVTLAGEIEVLIGDKNQTEDI